MLVEGFELNILLINHYAGSCRDGMEYRPYYLAREWVRAGHIVRILAASFSHVRTHQPELKRTRHDETIDGIDYTWFRTPGYQGNGASRVVNMAAFIRRLWSDSRGLADAFRPDWVIASSTYPMDIWPAARIARRAGSKLVFEVHDLWPLSPMELGGMPCWHPFIMMVQAAENYAYRHADAVVSMLPKTEGHMREHGLASGKFSYVPNGVDVAEWEAGGGGVPEEVAGQLAAFRTQFPFLVGYAGAHGLANALQAFIRAAVHSKNEGIGYCLIGQGPEKTALRRLAEAEGADNVLFLEPVPKGSIPRLLSRLDAFYIGLQRQPLFRFGVSPNKLMDYMMAAKPVVYAVEAGNNIVAESGCGISIAPEEPTAIAGAVRRLMRMSNGERQRMGRRGRVYVLAHHTYPVLARRFLEVLE